MNEYTLTQEQTEALGTIDGISANVTAEAGTNPIKAMQMFEEWAKKFPGKHKKDEESPNHAKRILFLSALFGVSPEQVSAGKATTSALAQASFARHLGQPVDEVIDVIKKEKEEAIDEGELALSKWDAGAVAVSDSLKDLSDDDLAVVTSATHASFHTALRMLSTVDNPFPAGAGEFVSYLLGASGGSGDWFECSDKFIELSKGVSASTIKRQRKALVDWQEATGKGIVDIRQETAKPTAYRVNLLGTVSTIVQGLLSRENVNPQHLAVVAATAKQLTEGNVKAEVSDVELSQAKELNAEIAEAVDALPAPTFEGSTSAEGRRKDAVIARFKELAKQVKQYGKIAETANLEKTKAAFDKFASEIAEDLEKFTKGETAMDAADNWLNQMQARINRGIASIEENTKTLTERAQEKAEGERKATGETSNETAQELASAQVASITAPEQAKAERKAAFDTVKTKLFLLAELLKGDEIELAATATRLHELIDEAFAGQGEEAEATEDEESTDEATA